MSLWLEIFLRENLSTITKLSNILKNEKSPYLQQHKDNPVDWFPWNKETLEKANQQEIKDKYLSNTEFAYKNGVFGSPSFIYDSEVFWGDDRLEDCIKWINLEDK